MSDATADDPVSVATLVEQYQTWSTTYLEQVRGSFAAAESYNRKRREAIDTILTERHARRGVAVEDEPQKGSGP